MKKRRSWQVVIGLLMGICLLAGCGKAPAVVEEQAVAKEPVVDEQAALEENEGMEYSMSLNEGLKKAQGIKAGYGTTYEVFVYSFCDSNGDGIGDLKGLTGKLNYIEDMGFDGLWLMPVMPSTTYHKYDVTDYYDIDPEYGSMEDFEALVRACDERGIRVIIDLVINHSSSKHPWFLEACEYLAGLDGKEPNEEECPEVGYYHFSKEQKSKYYQVPGTTDWYYEGQFWSEMPDLNLGNENLRKEIEEITAFWLEKGVAGFRLDAAKEFYTGVDSANVDVLTWFEQTVKAQKEDVYVVAEVWSDTATYAAYYDSGIDSVFDFAFADSTGIIAGVVNGSKSASGYGKAMEKVQEDFAAHNPDYIDAPFYTNHDMGRSAGYYSGENAEKQVKIAGALNLLMSGNTFTYYGEELGMKGAGKDENKRAPMYWSAEKSSRGMCQGPPEMDSVKMKYPSYEEQKEDPYSIYNYYRQAVKVRNAFSEIIQGTVKVLPDLSSETISAFYKIDGENSVIVICNFSSKVQEVPVGILKEREAEIKAALYVDEASAKIEENRLTLPGYGIVILKE